MMPNFYLLQREHIIKGKEVGQCALVAPGVGHEGSSRWRAADIRHIPDHSGDCGTARLVERQFAGIHYKTFPNINKT